MLLNPPFSPMNRLVEYVVFKLWMPNFQRISFHVILRLQEVSGMADHHKTRGIDSCTFIRKFHFIIILISEYHSLPFHK